MKSRAIAVVVAVFLSAGVLPPPASEQDALTFIDEMIRGVGARPVVCPTQVLAGSQFHEMSVVCARFDGDFVTFETRWRQHLRRDAVLDQMDGSGRVPHTEPETAWQSYSGIHERIYSIGQVALGVRFEQGDIVMVYK